MMTQLQFKTAIGEIILMGRKEGSSCKAFDVFPHKLPISKLQNLDTKGGMKQVGILYEVKIEKMLFKLAA